MSVKPIPEGYHTITPYLIVEDAAKLLDFMKAAFDAKELFRHLGPGGSVAHAEAKIGDSMIMVGQARDQWKAKTAMLYLYVPDVDATFRRALAAGATSVQEPADQFYGDRNGGVEDPTGNQWWISTHKEDVSPEEMERRMGSKK